MPESGNGHPSAPSDHGPGELPAVAEMLNLLPEVTWDRCVRREGRGIVYGWIARDDGRSDFVVFSWAPSGVGFTTSSAKHSREFSERIFRHSANHRDCERVEDVFGELVRRKVALPPAPAEEAPEVSLPRETQQTICAWAEATFGPVHSNARVAARVNEEMAELLRHLTADDKHPRAAEECADVLIVLYRLATRLGVDLHEEVDRKMVVNRLRHWARDNTGHGYHVRPEKNGGQP